MRILATLTAAFLLSFISGSAVASTYSHWGDNEPGFPRGYAYIQDQTPANWPVYTAAINWDQASKLDLVYQAGTGSCPSHCVPFVANAVGQAGCAGLLGVTTANAGTHIQSASVRVDSACAGQSYNGRLQIVCHEMGHAVGLNDRQASPSCMSTNISTLGDKPHPVEADWNDLWAAYGHDS